MEAGTFINFKFKNKLKQKSFTGFLEKPLLSPYKGTGFNASTEDRRIKGLSEYYDKDKHDF